MNQALAPVNPGDVFLGKYRVEKFLGMGAMGVVVAARHIDLDQRVAIKFLLAARATHAEMHERFVREARACARLRSQHVVRVSDVGRVGTNGAHYMVMELLDGHDLAAELAERGPLPIGKAVDYVLQACEAVAEAHQAGIVHRDLKPANLFLTRDPSGEPCVKVLDFGVSKLDGDGQRLTTDSQSLGSPLYMSPEQMQSSRDCDARADLWGLGVILYELLSGITPFHAETLASLCTNVLVKPPMPLRDHRPDAPAALEAVINQCLEKDRDRRFPSVAAFAAALAPFAATQGNSTARIAAVQGVSVEPTRPTVPMSQVMMASSSATVTSTSTSSALLPVAPPRRKTVAPVLALAGGIGLVALGGLLFLLRSANVESRSGAAGSAMDAASPVPTDSVLTTSVGLVSSAAPPIPSVSESLPAASASVLTSAAVTTPPPAPSETVLKNNRPKGTAPVRPYMPTPVSPMPPPQRPNVYNL